MQPTVTRTTTSTKKLIKIPHKAPIKSATMYWKPSSLDRILNDDSSAMQHLEVYLTNQIVPAARVTLQSIWKHSSGHRQW